MRPSKIVDDIVIPFDLRETGRPRFCFVVFSSKEKHVEIVIDCIERVLKEENNYEVKRLDLSLKSEDSQYKKLRDLLNDCSFAVVILDGLRPNVIFEYGLLKGLGKPCIVLLDEEATVDIINYFPDGARQGLMNPEINLDKHLSDVKDMFCVRYSRNRPREIRETIRKEYSKLRKDIDAEFFRMIFPEKNVVVKELEEQLIKLTIIINKKEELLNSEDEKLFRKIVDKIDEILKEYKITPPKYYLATIASIFEDFDKYDEALSIIDSIVEEKIEDAELISFKGYLLSRNGKLDEALETLNMGIELSPNTESLWHHKGLILEQMKREDEALLSYEKGAQIKDACPSIRFLYGMLLYEKDKFSDALEQFEKALEKKQTDDQFLIWKAKSLEKLGKTEKAREVIEEAISYNGQNPDAWFTLGQLTSDHSESLNYFERTLMIEPNHPGALCSKAAELSNLGKYDEALAIFERMVDLCPRPTLCNTLKINTATTLSKVKRFTEALKHVEDCLQLDKDNIEALEAKAVILLESGNIAESLEHLKILVERNPTNAGHWYNQSCVLARLNRIEESISSLNRAIELDPKFKEWMKTDSDFDGIRNTCEFRREFGQ